MADAARSPGRLGVFQTLREGLSLPPRAIGPLLLLNLAALGLMVILALVFVLPLQILRTVLEVGGLGASGLGAKVAEALPLVSIVLWWIIQAYVALCLLVAQYRIAAEVRAGLRPQSREVFYRPDPPLLPLASLVLVLGLGALMGFSALVVPGVVFLLVFGQALPAMIFEGTNVRGFLAASWRLTEGNLLSLLGLTLILLLLAFVPSLLSYLVAKAVGPGASLFIVLPTVTVAIVLLFAVSCLPALVAVIVYQHLRAQVAGSIPAEQPETDGVPA
ncbi:hypothetical protein [Phenylobacterium sp.]|uniref:hypothetical protein n=1 Tax=Phenylobacterium sp. TaxID=1871053 RepID=UPI0025FF5162|nr:hypothetical protein [Phenylobacterium sp.]MCA3746336.1 hypothetical protein [Phenylobacterium sp.]